MEEVLTVVRLLGPWGLLALVLLLNAAGVAALWLVLRYLPRREAQHEARVAALLKLNAHALAAYRAEQHLERQSRAELVAALSGRLDRIEVKLDRLAGGRPALSSPDPGDAA